MAGQAQIAALYPAVSASRIVAQAGVTALPGDSIGGVPSTVAAINTIFGWALAESTGSASAKVRLRDGTTAGGLLIATITLAQGESARDFFPVETPELRGNAIYLEVVSGSVEGAVYFG